MWKVESGPKDKDSDFRYPLLTVTCKPRIKPLIERDSKTIVCQRHVCGKRRTRDRMFEVMRHVCEENAACPASMACVDGFLQAEVRHVRLVPERSEHQHIEIRE